MDKNIKQSNLIENNSKYIIIDYSKYILILLVLIGFFSLMSNSIIDIKVLELKFYVNKEQLLNYELSSKVLREKIKNILITKDDYVSELKNNILESAIMNSQISNEELDISVSERIGLYIVNLVRFISFNEMPQIEVDSFYLNLSTHIEKKITGPYHAICSLVNVLPKIDEFKYSVFENKRIFLTKMKSHIINNPLNEPLLCTYVNCKISTDDKRVILYNSRANNIGSIVCHLGEAHLGKQAKGDILELISF